MKIINLTLKCLLETSSGNIWSYYFKHLNISILKWKVTAKKEDKHDFSKYILTFHFYLYRFLFVKLYISVTDMKIKFFLNEDFVRSVLLKVSGEWRFRRFINDSFYHESLKISFIIDFEDLGWFKSWLGKRPWYQYMK